MEINTKPNGRPLSPLPAVLPAFTISGPVGRVLSERAVACESTLAPIYAADQIRSQGRGVFTGTVRREMPQSAKAVDGLGTNQQNPQGVVTGANPVDRRHGLSGVPPRGLPN